MNTNVAPDHIVVFAWPPYTATLRRSDTALRTVKMSVTVSDDTRPVSLLTPMTQSNCVSVFAERYKSVEGSTSGTDEKETVGPAVDRASSVAMLSRER